MLFIDYFRYPVNVIIHIPRKNGEELYFDKAQRRTDKHDGKLFFRLKRMGKNAPAYAFESMIRTNKGLYAELYSPAPGEFYQCHLDNDPIKKKVVIMGDDGIPTTQELPFGGIRPLNVDQKNFYAEEIDRTHRRWQKQKGFLDKMLPILLVAIFAFSLILMMWGYAEYGGEFVAQAAQRAAATWENVAQTAGTVVEKTQSVPITPPPPA